MNWLKKLRNKIKYWRRRKHEDSDLIITLPSNVTTINIEISGGGGGGSDGSKDRS